MDEKKPNAVMDTRKWKDLSWMEQIGLVIVTACLGVGIAVSVNAWIQTPPPPTPAAKVK